MKGIFLTRPKQPNALLVKILKNRINRPKAIVMLGFSLTLMVISINNGGLASAQSVSAPDDAQKLAPAEFELGWRFAGCQAHFQYNSEIFKAKDDAKSASSYQKMSVLNMLAALAILGTERYKAGMQNIFAEFGQRLKSNDANAAFLRYEDSCIELNKAHIARLTPRIEALAKNFVEKTEKAPTPIATPTVPLPKSQETPTNQLDLSADPFGLKRVPYVSEIGQNTFKEYQALPTPKAFAISRSGVWRYAHLYTNSIPNRSPDPKTRAIENCEAVAKVSCVLYAVDEKIVFRAEASPYELEMVKKLHDVNAVPHLSKKGKEVYRDWLDRPFPRAFAVSATGGWVWAAYGSKPADPTLPEDVAERALLGCRRVSGNECKIYAIDEIVVWQ
jgi:hypothetical protein